MNEKEFYNYIQENFTLDGTSSRLVQNIIDFVSEEWDEVESAHIDLWRLLDGAFGLTEKEVLLYRGDELEPQTKPSLAETLKVNAQKSKEIFGSGDSSTPEKTLGGDAL